MNIKIALDKNHNETAKSQFDEFFQGKDVSINYVSITDDYDVLLTGLNGEKTTAMVAHINGKAVVNSAEHMGHLEYNDLIEGYLANTALEKSDQWYARVFKVPVVITNPNNLELRLGATINPRAIILNNGLEGQGGHVLIDRGTHIGADCLLNLGPTNFKTGKFSLISANFSAHAMRHTTNHISNYALKKGPFAFMGDIYQDAQEIKIGNDVWIGEGVTCLPGIEIVTGSVIGAGSVMTKSTEPYGIYAGNPAEFIRPRFNENVINTLMQSEWWNYSYKKLKDIQNIFLTDIQDMSAEQVKEILQC